MTVHYVVIMSKTHLFLEVCVTCIVHGNVRVACGLFGDNAELVEG